MAPNKINQSNGKDLWTFSSFATLGGCVFAAYVVKSILVRFLRTPQELTGFIVSIAVAFASLHFASKINLKNAILALFNGCLIFFTLIGGTSFSASFTTNTANEEFRKKNPLIAAFITPLNQDKNLIEKEKNLVKKTVRLERKLQSLDSEIVVVKDKVRNMGFENEFLIKNNHIYEKGFNSLNQYIGRISPTKLKKSRIQDRISITRMQILKDQEKNKLR